MGALALRVFLFGDFRVEVDGKELAPDQWNSKKALSLFKYLVCRRSEKVAKDVLAEILWPDPQDISPDHNLHTTIYMLRRTLEPSLDRYQRSAFVKHSHGLYWLPSDAPCWTDVQEFQHLIEQGKELEVHKPLIALNCFEKALELYTDDLLTDEQYADWTVMYREHYRELFFETTIRTANLLVERKHSYQRAAKMCQKALRKDPYREDLHEVAISCLIKAKHYEKAIAQYRKCARLLETEFGLKPSNEIEELINSIPSVGSEAATTESDPSESKQGALICDKATFAMVYQLECRRQIRNKVPVLLLTLTSKKALEAEGDAILSGIAKTLRAGDVICQTDSHHIKVLATGADSNAVPIIVRRLTRLAQLENQFTISIEMKTENTCIF